MSEVKRACSSSGAGESVMGRKTCGVPVRVKDLPFIPGEGGIPDIGGPTIARKRASVTVSVFVLSHNPTVHDHMTPALRLDELAVASARKPLAIIQLPLLEAAQSQVLSEQDVEGGVDGPEGVVADEHQRVEALEDHADLRGRVPTVVASGREVRLFEPVSASSAHGVQKRGTVLAVERVFWAIGVERGWRHVDLGRFDGAVSISVEVGEVAGAVSKTSSSDRGLVTHSSTEFCEKGILSSCLEELKKRLITQKNRVMVRMMVKAVRLVVVVTRLLFLRAGGVFMSGDGKGV